MNNEHATQMHEPLGDNLVKYVCNKLKMRLYDNSTPDYQYQGGDVFELGGPGGFGYTVMQFGGEVVYFVRHCPIKANRHNFGRQVLVRGCKDSQEVAGFARYVFFKRLLPKYGALLADTLQTEEGKRFWRNAINTAQTSGLHCYFLDRRSSSNRLIPLKTAGDVTRHHGEIWGETQGHLRTHAVIANHPLSLD
jgi:hypothetical protein